MTPGRKIYAYSPYLDTLGGGERYFAELVSALSILSKSHLIVHAEQLGFLDKISRLFATGFRNVEIVTLSQQGRYTDAVRAEIQSHIGPDSIFIQVSNGELLNIAADITIAHVQIVVPRDHDRFYDREKLRPFAEAIGKQNLVIFPSRYVAGEMAIRFRLRQDKVICLYPPVNSGFVPAPVERGDRIVNVGRFLPLKRQWELIHCFRKLAGPIPSQLSFTIVGPNETPLLGELKKTAAGYDIGFTVGLDVQGLANLFSRSLLFWSACGLNESEFGLVETFGLSIAEAMACGCVPVAINRGGVAEVIHDGEDGFLVDTPAALVNTTAMLLSDRERLRIMSLRAIEQSQRFSVTHFASEVGRIFGGLT